MAQLSILLPVDPLVEIATNNVLVTSEWGKSDPPEQTSAAILKIACEQLSTYFNGRLEKFNLPVAPSRTSFRHRIWKVMADTPYGQAHACD